MRGLKKSLGGRTILSGVDLDLFAGQNLILLGRSGSGKSLLMKCILGLVTPDEGSIQIADSETVQLRTAERLALMEQIGVLFQNGALFDSLPVWQNIAFRIYNSRHAEERRVRELAIRALKRIGLGAEVADLLPAELSGGMQKRVALARALFGDPPIIFLDNPTAGLDPIMTAVIDSVISSSIKQLRAAVMTITFDLESAARIGKCAAFLGSGRILWEGQLNQLPEANNVQVQEFVRAAYGNRIS